MLRLIFREGRSIATIPDVSAFEFRGGEIWPHNHSKPLAIYKTGSWIYEGKRWGLIECHELVFVQFVGDLGLHGPQVGPRPAFSVRGPYAFAGRARIAKLLAVGLWQGPDPQSTWRVLRVLPSNHGQFWNDSLAQFASQYSEQPTDAQS
jgi:hypothetical protein